MVELKPVHLPEIDRVVYVRPLDDLDRELFAVEWAALTAPWTIGFPKDKNPAGILPSLVFRIAFMAAVTKSSKPFFQRHDFDQWLAEFSWEPDKFVGIGSMMFRITDTALVKSRWIPRGKNPIFRFFKKHEKYFPDQEAFQYALAANRLLSDDYRIPAVKKLVEAHPAPIYYKRFIAIINRINLDNLPETKRIAAREASILTFGADGNRVSFNRFYRRAAERLMEIDILPPARKRGEKYDPPEPKAFDLGYTAIPQDRKRKTTSVDGDIEQWSAPSQQSKDRKPDWSKERTEFEKVEHLLLNNFIDLRNAIFSEYSVRSAFMPMDRYVELRDLERIYSRLSIEDQLTVKCLYENYLDYEATAREMRIENSTLRKRIERIRKPKNSP